MAMIQGTIVETREDLLLSQWNSSVPKVAMAPVMPMVELRAAKSTAMKKIRPKKEPPGISAKTVLRVMNSKPAPVEGSRS